MLRGEIHKTDGGNDIDVDDREKISAVLRSRFRFIFSVDGSQLSTTEFHPSTAPTLVKPSPIQTKPVYCERTTATFIASQTRTGVGMGRRGSRLKTIVTSCGGRHVTATMPSAAMVFDFCGYF
mmetsp:Transcript_16009/g.29036  ORF Transcript_16009/g.29036 Transcript_16009/m.29036 type:complete len:123 (+) Transcript_16009:441-809(+)